MAGSSVAKTALGAFCPAMTIDFYSSFSVVKYNG